MLIKLLLGNIIFVSVISNATSPVELVITQVDDHVKIKLTLQLIKGISRVLQKLFKYFNGTIISASFSLLSSGVFPVIFILDILDFSFYMIQNLLNYHLVYLCNIVTNFQMFLHNYHYNILLNYTLAL